ncbi:ankyrin repeat protein [Aspergillus sp. HF37]|nr:ankyrin repeat protein [Aspergillus sp. HF37]
MGLVPDGETSRGDLEGALSVAVERFYSSRNKSASMEIIKSLLDAGADVLELVGRYKTALEMAEAYGFEDVVQLLLRYRKHRDEAEELMGLDD